MNGIFKDRLRTILLYVRPVSKILFLVIMYFSLVSDQAYLSLFFYILFILLITLKIKF